MITVFYTDSYEIVRLTYRTFLSLTYKPFNILLSQGESLSGIVVKELNRGTVVSQFELQSHYSFHFWAYTLVTYP